MELRLILQSFQRVRLPEFRGVWPQLGMTFVWIGVSLNLIMSSVVDTLSLSLTAAFGQGNRPFVDSWDDVPNLLRTGWCMVSSTMNSCYAQSTHLFFFLPFFVFSV